MKNLKLFNTENDYLTYRDSSEYLKPNVSLCDDKGSVYYNFTPPPIVYEAVDLGLPSGTKWAAQNVGARKPSDYGLYFQWGDTSGYTADQVGKDKQFSWSDYKWSIDGSSSNFSKYTTTGATLDLEDDAAHVNMGGSWHMPTPTQIQELIDNTTTAWTTSNGTGMTFTSKKDTSKSIFFPAAGRAWDGSLHSSGDNGGVWSSMLSLGDVGGGQGLGFFLYNAGLDYGDVRFDGFSVRGVLSKD
jgi:hypothetical protein